MFEGTTVALVTPFRNGKVDWEKLERLIEFHIEKGTDTLLPCGTTGESATLTHEEHKEVIKFVVEKAEGKIKVMAGTGSNSTDEALELSHYAKEVGADGILVITPYYNKPTQKGLYLHFEKIAREVDIPMVLYNVPSRTGVNLEAATVKDLAEIPNIVAVKEASGKMDQIMQIISFGTITVLSGDDSLTFPIMALGGKGVVSVAANIVPEKVKKMVDSALEGRWEEARKLHYELYPLFKVLFIETNPIPVKTALKEMGMIEEELRLPLAPMSEENREKLLTVLRRLGII
ncbi:MAG TPA: 4-hydroxy-tetrahydrodipicolinate synthase [bacterium]|nr:4-hydroxy-tetrahydrodipicolinate synthase [bacterium]HEX68327.1 4-hydroxy-tetrahydrodipicolinate synthase [bacterium]